MPPFEVSYDPHKLVKAARQRLDDAQALLATGKRAHATGAVYLGGFAIEILLKARLVRQYPGIAAKQQHEINERERHIWNLIWRQHNLSAMLLELPQLESALIARSEIDQKPYWKNLKEFCSFWKVHLRYAADRISMNDARRKLQRIDQLMEHLE